MGSPLASNDVERIHELYPIWTDRLLQQDFEAMVKLYTEDAVIMPPNHPKVEGRAAMLAFMRSFPRVTRAAFEVDEVGGCDDIAFVCGKYFMTLEPEGVPAPIEDEGKYIEIRRKQADGSWPIARDIFNSSLQAASP